MNQKLREKIICASRKKNQAIEVILSQFYHSQMAQAICLEETVSYFHLDKKV